jgi:hypothetical protein
MKQAKTEPSPIAIDDLFHSPEGFIAKLAAMQVHLYRRDVSLQDYFHALDREVLDVPRGASAPRSPISPIAAWSVRAADRASHAFRPRKVKTDVLFCPTPYFGRKTENRLLARTLLGLAQTGAEVLCLLSQYVPFRNELESELAAAHVSKQVTFLDPGVPINRVEARTRSMAARLRGRAAFEKTVQILEPHGLSPTWNALADFEKTALYVEAWERLASSIEFGAVVTRCHWYDLCSCVCRTGAQRGKPVIAFQQGVITHTLDVPITASKFVTFGAPSASVFAEANRRFFDAVRMPEPRVQYFNAGSLFDTVVPLPNQYSLHTLLIVDLHSISKDPFGTEGQTRALLQLTERLLAARLPIRRVVIRPHPHASNWDLEACLKLVRDNRDVCELSHPAWSLEDDLRRSSVALGIWSGVLTVASACGLPTIFLQTEEGVRTRDLACFAPAQTLLPDEAFLEISKLFTGPQDYAEAQQAALRNASEYYTNGANAALDGAFFARLLRD